MATSTLDSRREQMFPRLEPEEVERLRRFGTVETFAAGDWLVRAGKQGPGMFIVLHGEVAVTRKDVEGRDQIIADEGPGHFLAELAQLSGAPGLVDARAKTEVETLVIPPARLRALLVAEAELGERIMRALILRRVGLIELGAGPIIVGHPARGDVLRLQNFLTRNGHPFKSIDPQNDAAARTLLEQFHVADKDLPIVVCPSGSFLRNPTEDELARCIGLVAPIDPDRVFDVAVVGAGPAGLATAVYAASEGLSVLVMDCRAFGGQAGASARIENYLGFPTGISGMALMGRAYSQAQKFGATLAIPDEVVTLNDAPDPDHGRFSLRLGNGETVSTRSVVIASGARYRRLAVDNLDAFEGTSVHYWASPQERQLCEGQEIALVGAGNSAGQAVVFLAGRVGKVWLLVRGADLASSMSQYLVDRITGLPNVEVVTNAEIVALEGQDGVLDAVRWRDCPSGAETRRAIAHVFLFIGAQPNTDWLAGCEVTLDDKGFVCTGAALTPDHPLLATSREGVFAIGDVRAGSTKRVASAVGEGAQVVATIHGYLADSGGRPAR